MPEGVSGYPRWQGSLGGPPAFLVVAAEDVRRATRNMWSQMALILVFAYAVIFLGSLNSLADARGAAAAHTWQNFTFFAGNLRWGSLAIAAVMAPALLEDHRRGALELYFARAIPRREYLLGKVLAVFGLTFLAFLGPALLYIAGSYMLFDAQPAGWERAAPGVFVYALLWSLMVAGLGLGLSCVAKSSRGATLMLFGGLAAADIFVANLLEGITRNPAMQLLSPFSAIGQQVEWLFGVPAPYQFETWWGLVEVLLLAAIGWALVAWKQPRLSGEV